MTRKEYSGIRELKFSTWVREKLPCSSTGYMASDLDFFLWNFKTKKLIMLEIKTRNTEPKLWQSNMWKNIEKWINFGISDGWEFKGYHLIKFENTSFEDGKCYLNSNEIAEDELIIFLSMYE
jgi:hypothetical protein